MVRNAYLLLTESKNKLSKKEERDRHGYGTVLMVARWEGAVGEWVKRQGD